MSKKVCLRTTANKEIGFGHLIRCLSIVEILNGQVPCVIYHTGISSYFIEQITLLGAQHLEVKHEDDWITTLNEGDIVIIDLYDFDEIVVKKIHSKKVQIIRIDDFASGVLQGDFLINHAPNIDSKLYKGNFNGQLLLGQEYSLLRSCFLKNQNKRNFNELKTIFLSLGGGVKEDELIFILLKIMHFNMLTTINLVLARSVENEQLLQLCNDSKIKVFENLSGDEIKNLFDISDLAIVPSSTLSLEAFARNIPLVAILTAENQRYIFNGLKNEDGVLCIEQNELFNNENFPPLENWFQNVIELDRKVENSKLIELLKKLINE